MNNGMLHETMLLDFLVPLELVEAVLHEHAGVGVDELNGRHVDKHQLAIVLHILSPTFHDEPKSSESHGLFAVDCLLQLMESVTQVNFLGKRELEDVDANIMLDDVIVTGPSRPDTSEAALIDATDQLFGHQVTRIVRIDSLLPYVQSTFDLLLLISFENRQYLIDTMVLAVVLILAAVDLVDPCVEHLGLKAVTLNHQSDV